MRAFLEKVHDKLRFEFIESLKVCRHEFKNIFSDFGILIVFFGTIILYPVLYPYAYSNEVLKDLPVAVVDHDKSAMSRQLIRMLDANDILRVETKPESLQQAKNIFFKNRVDGVIVIPGDFSKRILRGDQTSVSVYCDAGYFLVYRQVFKGASLAVGTMSAGIEFKRLTAGGMPEGQAKNFIEPLRLANNFLYNPAGGYASYVMPAVFLVLLQQTLLMGIGMLGGTARERKQFHFFVPQGTMTDRVIPLIIGKGGAYFAIYMIHAIYIFGILFRVYNYPQRGSVLDLGIFFISFLSCVIAMAMAISAFFRNREISIMFVVITSIPCIILGGFSWPPEAMPQYIRILSYVIPSTAGVEGLLKLSQMGAGLPDIIDILFILWGLTVFYLILAVLYYRRIVQRFSEYKS